MTIAGRSAVSGSGSPSSVALRRGVVRHIYSHQGVIEYASLEGEAAEAGENVDDDDAGNDAVPMSSGRPPMVTSSAASEGVVVDGRPRRTSSSSSSSSSSNASSRSSPTAPAARPRSRRSSFAHLASRLMPTIQEDEELKIVPHPVNVRPNHRVSSPLHTSPRLPPSSPPPHTTTTTTTTTMPLPPGYPVPQGQAAPAAPRVAGRAPPGYYEELERMQSEFWRQGNAGLQLSQHTTQFQYQSQQQQQQQQQRAEYHRQLQHMEQLQQQQQNAPYQQQLRQYEQHQARQQQQYHLLLHQHQRRQQQLVYQQQHAAAAAAVHVNGANMLPRALGTLPSLPTAAASSNNLARGFTMAAPPQHVHTHAHAGYAGYHAAPTAAAAAGPHNHFMNPVFNHNHNTNPIFINTNASANANNRNHNLTRPSTTASTTSTSSSTTLTNPPTNMHTTTTTTHTATTANPPTQQQPTQQQPTQQQRTRRFDPDAPLPPGMRGPPIISPMVPFYAHLEALALLRRRFVREQLRREGRAAEEDEAVADQKELVDVRDRGVW